MFRSPFGDAFMDPFMNDPFFTNPLSSFMNDPFFATPFPSPFMSPFGRPAMRAVSQPHTMVSTNL